MVVICENCIFFVCRAIHCDTKKQNKHFNLVKSHSPGFEPHCLHDESIFDNCFVSGKQKENIEIIFDNCFISGEQKENIEIIFDNCFVLGKHKENLEIIFCYLRITVFYSTPLPLHLLESKKIFVCFVSVSCVSVSFFLTESSSAKKKKKKIGDGEKLSFSNRPRLLFSV